MNRQKAERFAFLVERQRAGESGATSGLRDLAPSLEDGYCLYNAYEQWKGAFSFSPGALRCLPVIASLAQKILNYPKDDTLIMYSEPEWKELLIHRGPFECAIRYTCSDCRVDYIGFGQSGFDDRYPSICNSCGDVWLQSGYDEEALPTCGCGGRYISSGCPKCGSNKSEEKDYFSSYEYFLKHKWKDKRQQTV